jgi:hypothetical protein
LNPSPEIDIIISRTLPPNGANSGKGNSMKIRASTLIQTSTMAFKIRDCGAGFQACTESMSPHHRTAFRGHLAAARRHRAAGKGHDEVGTRRQKPSAPPTRSTPPHPPSQFTTHSPTTTSITRANSLTIPLSKSQPLKNHPAFFIFINSACFAPKKVPNPLSEKRRSQNSFNNNPTRSPFL